ncbi:MAG: osmotically inducible protein C [Planctomycetota bacterium]|nr:MAG: osmotically inducible protein C [Planctomycetota bacterium]
MTETITTRNGIDLIGLERMADDVARDPSRGIAKFRVNTNWMGGTRSETRVEDWELGGRRLPRGFSIATDEPPELLGRAAAPNPQEVLMAGLNACMMVGYVAGCAAHGIELRSISIETEGELDLRGFLGLDASVKPGYEEIRYTVRLRGDGAPEAFQRVHETVMAQSP